MRLTRSVFAARLGGDMVLLDAVQGQYFCLPEAAEAFTADDAGLSITDPDLAGELQALGLLSKTLATKSLAVRAVATQDLPQNIARTPTAGEWRDGAATYATMLRRYYRKPFGAVLDYARRGRRTQDALATEALVARVGAFQNLLPWAPFPGVCLYRSFMLLAFLRRAGLDATWMFGVRTWPFEAHCWLQAGDVVLDDLAERVSPFTPIMAV